MRRLVPIVDWLPRYDRSALRGDVLAGIAVAAMIVPKDLGYAGIAGVPVQNGLYAAAAGAIVYALFCTSRHISTGPSSSLAAVAGGAVLVAGVGESEAAELVAAITLVTGALFLLLAALRLGWIARFLSRAVVTGFLAGAAVDVVIGELPKLTGTETSGETAWAELASWIRSLDDISGTTLLVGVVALAVILALRFSAPRVPGALVLVVGGLLATPAVRPRRARRRARRRRAARPARAGPAGPRRLPAALRDDPRRRRRAAPDRLLADRRRCPGVRGPAPLPHRRRSGVGRAGHGQRRGRRVPAGCRSRRACPPARSTSRPAPARRSRRSSPAGSCILTLVALAPLFSELPKAVLAAIIIDAVVFGMIDIPELRRLHRVKRFDFWVAAAAIVAVLSAGVLAGVVIGIALSLVWLVYVATSPGMPLLGREPGTQVFRDARENPGDETFPGYAVVRLDGGLFFATAEALEERVRELAQDADPPLRAVVLDMEGVDFVDSQGAAKLAEILDFAESAGVELRLARREARRGERARGRRRPGAPRRRPRPRERPAAVEAQLAADRGERDPTQRSSRLPASRRAGAGGGLPRAAGPRLAPASG